MPREHSATAWLFGSGLPVVRSLQEPPTMRKAQPSKSAHGGGISRCHAPVMRMRGRRSSLGGHVEHVAASARAGQATAQFGALGYLSFLLRRGLSSASPSPASVVLKVGHPVSQTLQENRAGPSYTAAHFLPEVCHVTNTCQLYNCRTSGCVRPCSRRTRHNHVGSGNRSAREEALRRARRVLERRGNRIVCVRLYRACTLPCALSPRRVRQLHAERDLRHCLW
jgi:hypothetical protein